MNSIELQGNLTANPVVRKTKTGKTVTTFYLAVDRRFTNNAGERSKKTNYFKIVAWDILGQAAAYLTKGQNVIVQGSAEVQNWQGTDKNWHSVNEVTANSIGVSIINLFKEVIATDASNLSNEISESTSSDNKTTPEKISDMWTQFEQKKPEQTSLTMDVSKNNNVKV